MSEQQEAWLLDEQFKQEFLDECKLAATDDEAFSRFRSMNRIHTVIENNNEEFKRIALEYIDANFTHEQWIRFGSSDRYGVDNLFPDYLMPSNVQPNTVRYVYIMNLMRRLFNYDPIRDIVEIGAGYGGQCKILHDISLISTYTIYDLPEVQLLQKRFLNKFGINPVLKQLPDEIEHADLCISWCCFGELSREAKIEYYNKIISKCDRYFICSNYNLKEDMDILSSNGEQLMEYKDELYQGVIYWSKYF